MTLEEILNQISQSTEEEKKAAEDKTKGIFDMLGIGLNGITNILLGPIDFARETVTRFNLQTIRRTIEIAGTMCTESVYPKRLDTPPFSTYLSPLPKAMLKMSIKEGNNSNEVYYVTGNETMADWQNIVNKGGYIYDPVKGNIKINSIQKSLFGTFLMGEAGKYSDF